MGLFTSPTSYRLNADVAGNNFGPPIDTNTFSTFAFMTSANDHSSHPPLGHLILLVFEAVMEVVCVSLPGYIVARQGMFDADKQKFVANLNVALFTPCLSMFYALSYVRRWDDANTKQSSRNWLLN
jgi:auxin efflux carrier family protein